jgi:AhpD family alkylhydroperoxidase
VDDVHERMHMTSHTTHAVGHDGPAAEKLADLRQPTKELRRRIPDVYDGFLKTSRATMVDGALPAKYKELIALALGVSQHCEGCIAYHARGAARQGASEREVAEALGVTILLNGGPAASDYAPRALAAFREFVNDRAGSD